MCKKAGIVGIVFLVTLYTSCSRIKQDKMFEVIAPEYSGINFSNTIQSNDTLNVIDFYYIYNGAGLGVGDVNNDGLQDVFFAGNQVSNQLYLNKGAFQFEDITADAGISAEDIWGQGVSMVDINNDGWLDIYVCASIYGTAEARTNKLFINQGLNENGVPTFTEEAEKWGIDDKGHSSNSAFFDYDLDGDLDLFVLSNFMDRKFPSRFRPKSVDGSSVNADKLYENLGHEKFQDVSIEAGILVEGYSHGISIRDIDLDGWPDIYITNDFLPNDVLYINNQDGTFTNKITDYIKHQSFSAMGHDIADINNDGLQDIFSLDMLPEMNYRKKTMLLRNNPMTQINYEKFQYDLQYVRNMLQLNMGPDNHGNMKFSEIGLLAGVQETDWSWSPLFADFDNDGYKDLVVCNGFQHDVTDMDFAKSKMQFENLISRVDLNDSIPVVKIDNYIFKNNGDLTFTKKTEDWGFEEPTLSNGAAFVDLDNDGDLDYITNNINGPATVYKNNINDENTSEKPNYIRINLKGSDNNLHGLGAKLILYINGNLQFHEHSFYRGFMSSVDMNIHFGLGETQIIDSLIIFWPEGSLEKLTNIEVNNDLIIDYSNSRIDSTIDIRDYLLPDDGAPYIKESNENYQIAYEHQEKQLFDFNYQRTLPHKFSQSTPGIAVGDINNDGLDDFYIGGSKSYPGTFFVQQDDNTFKQEKRIIKDSNKNSQDMGILLFDVDNDKDLDLYLVRGGVLGQARDEVYIDQLYVNDGKGYFSYQEELLPEIAISGSCVKAADFDRDGDLDLFTGGRIVPGEYPYAVSSSILMNEGGTFVEVTDSFCPDLKDIGLVTDALWTDFNNDQWIDLIVVGEFMPLTFFKNTGNGFVNITETIKPGPTTGWWNSIVGTDFDNDGDTDYIAGNFGLNSIFKGTEEYPLKVYANDFDKNGIVDPVIVTYVSDEYFDLQPFPVHTRDDMTNQLGFIKTRLPTYKDYGRATITDMFTAEELNEAYSKEANFFKTVILLNEGNDEFTIKELPIYAQFAPVFGILPTDINNDGNIDIIMVGNDYSIEQMSGKIDAFYGLLLLGNGDGSFDYVKTDKSGFIVSQDAKGLARLFDGSGKELFLATQNKDSLLVFSKMADNPVMKADPRAQWAEMTLKGGKIRKHEFYYGSSYLSQSSRDIPLTPDITHIRIFDADGNVLDDLEIEPLIDRNYQ